MRNKQQDDKPPLDLDEVMSLEQHEASLFEPITAPPMETPTESREITVDAFTRTGNELRQAFAITEKLKSLGRVVKRTSAEWDAAYNLWLGQKR